MTQAVSEWWLFLAGERDRLRAGPGGFMNFGLYACCVGWTSSIMYDSLSSTPLSISICNHIILFVNLIMAMHAMVYRVFTRESVDSLCKDGTDLFLGYAYVHRKCLNVVADHGLQYQ